MKTTSGSAFILVFLLAVTVSACRFLPGDSSLVATSPTPAQPSPVPPTETALPPKPLDEAKLELATIESLEVLTEELSSDQVSVRLRGVLPTTCAQVDNIVTERVGSDFNIAILILQEPSEECSEQIVPFEELVALDVSGLDAGSYNVTANERQVSFNLTTEEPEPEPAEAAEAAPTGASIAGLVWHDSCANLGLDNVDLPPGCILTGSNAFLGDGVLEDEEGVARVEVAIGNGECPAVPEEYAFTDNQGAYVFSDLDAGTYCLFIDMTRIQNQGILGAGSWTAPDRDAPEITITLNPGDVQENVNFGWDFLDLPASETDLADCTNSFEFVADLSVPDDTVFAAGETFTKQWQLRNNGTCPWSTDYSITFVGGDQMASEDAVALDQIVPTGQDLEVSIDMVAPEEPGTYRGNWQVADANGEPFGIDGIIDDAFWLQIIVDEDAQPSSTPLPNSGAIGGVVWDDFCINSDPDQGCVEVTADSGVFVADGTFGPGESPLGEIEISLAEGACPADGALPPDTAVIERALTDSRGIYQFVDLAEGPYCVFMDALDEAMVDLLIPGNWTWPGTGVGQYSIVLDPGEEILDLDFGWDYVD